MKTIAALLFFGLAGLILYWSGRYLVREVKGSLGYATSAPSSVSPTPAATPDKEQERARKQVRQYVQLMIDKGGITRLDADAGRAWIDPLLWHSADAQLKENITRSIAVCCGGSAELYDAQTARKIASCDVWHGFQVY